MKKFLIRFLQGLLIVIGILMLIPILTGRIYLYKAVLYNYADIDDYKIFSNRTVKANAPLPLKVAPQSIPIPDSLQRYLDSLKTVALLVIKDSQIVHEQYARGYNDSAYSGSFSVAKSIVSILIGVALKEGKITTLQDPVGKYLEEFRKGDKAKLRIVDLLTMSSGTDWDESYSSPMSITTQAYYGRNLNELAKSVSVIRNPGTLHDYKSGDSELLGLILMKVTGKTLSEYASEKLWTPLGAMHDALWSIDRKDGVEKAYCCFNSNARDFARIGLFMLDSGRINSQPVIDPSYWKASITPCMIPDVSGQPCDYYGYQWWIVPEEPGIFYARGILGQYIICIPEKKMVIVRLGEKRDREVKRVLLEVRKLLDWAKGL